MIELCLMGKKLNKATGNQRELNAHNSGELLPVTATPAPPVGVIQPGGLVLTFTGTIIKVCELHGFRFWPNASSEESD